MKVIKSNKEFSIARLESAGKNRLRQFIFNHLPKGKWLLDFYGTGGTFFKATKLGINILSIDTGKDFQNAKTIKKMQAEGKNVKFVALRDLCKQWKPGDQTFHTAHLDYCGSFSTKKTSDIKYLQKIMENKGNIFITLTEGHERGFPKGTHRKIIREVTMRVVKQELRDAGFKNVKTIYKDKYLSIPAYANRQSTTSSPLLAIGFSYEKK